MIVTFANGRSIDMDDLFPRLRKVISGCQNGADQAGLYVAKSYGYETGGWIPKGFKTLDGPKPEFVELYGIQEHDSPYYPPRTCCNVRDSDGTLRFAFDFTTAGELCTLKAINQYKKPYADVDLNKDTNDIKGIVNWLIENKIETLNVAGNSNNTNRNTFDRTQYVFGLVLKELELYD